MRQTCLSDYDIHVHPNPLGETEKPRKANLFWPRVLHCSPLFLLLVCLNTFLVVRLKFLSSGRQILDLLHVRDKLTAPGCHGVAVGAVHLMAEERPGFARPLLLLPLLAPLRRCVPAPGRSRFCSLSCDALCRMLISSQENVVPRRPWRSGS